MRLTACSSLALLLLVSACSLGGALPVSGIRAGVAVQGIVFRNELPYPVRDVRMLVTQSGHFAACGHIMARSECRTAFAAIDYQGGTLVIRWKERGKPQSTGDFALKLPAPAETERPLWIEVIIFAPGEAAAKFEQ